MTLYFQGYDEYDVWDDLCLCKEEFDIGNYQYVIMSFQNVHQWNKLKLHLVQRKM